MSHRNQIFGAVVLLAAGLTGYSAKPANAADRVVVVEMFTATW